MSAHPRWVCNSCRSQIYTRFTSSIHAGKRGVATHTDIPAQNEEEGFEAPYHRAPRRPPQGQLARIRRYKAHSPSAKAVLQNKKSAEEAEAKLKDLFQSSGRELPSEPLTLRYSKLTLTPKAPVKIDSASKTPVSSKSSETAKRENEVLIDDGRGLAPRAIRKDRGKPLWNVMNQALGGEVSRISELDVLETHAGENGFRWSPLLDSHPMFDYKKASPGPSWLRHHVRERDLGRAATIWNDYELELLKGNIPKDRSTLFTDLTLFLSRAVQGKLLNEAVRIWKMFKQQGFKPNVRHWTMMLALAGRQRDLNSIKTIWSSMKTLREQPDNRTWAVLLASLASCTTVQWDDVATAMTEMRDQWSWLETPEGQKFLQDQSSQRKQLFGPNIVPFNACLHRTLENKRQWQGQYILNWIAESGLKPSVNTFNILLDPASKTGDMVEIRRLFSEMKVHGLEADPVTFTVVLDSMIRQITDDSDISQVQSDIGTIFADMTRINYTPASHTYATALVALLNRPDPNIGAARIVLKHMDENGIQPSLYVLTILVKYYMRPENPQVAAAEAIYRRILEKDHVVDHRFYDAMIQGFAAHGETDKMINLLRFVPRTGHLLSWTSMIAALNLLVKKREIEVAADLIEDLEKGEGIGRLGCVNPEAGRDFWNRVDEMRQRGLIRLHDSEVNVSEGRARSLRGSAGALEAGKMAGWVSELQTEDKSAVVPDNDNPDGKQIEQERQSEQSQEKEEVLVGVNLGRGWHKLV